MPEDGMTKDELILAGETKRPKFKTVKAALTAHMEALEDSWVKKMLDASDIKAGGVPYDMISSGTVATHKVEPSAMTIGDVERTLKELKEYKHKWLADKSSRSIFEKVYMSPEEFAKETMMPEFPRAPEKSEWPLKTISEDEVLRQIEAVKAVTGFDADRIYVGREEMAEIKHNARMDGRGPIEYDPLTNIFKLFGLKLYVVDEKSHFKVC